MGVVKPLVLVQKGEFREGLKRNWTVSLEMGVVVVGAKAVQRPTQGQSPPLGAPAGGGAGSRVQTNCVGSDQLCWGIAGRESVLCIHEALGKHYFLKALVGRDSPPPS